MIQPPKEKRIVTPAVFDVTLLSRVFLCVLGLLLLLVTASRFGPAQVRDIFQREETQNVFIWLLRWLDLGWAICAIFAAYWCCVIEEGLRAARRVCLVALVLVLAVLSLQRLSPFGPVIRFTDEFGSRLPGGLPIGIVLLWASLLLAIRSTVSRFGRTRATWISIAAAAAIAAFGSLLIESSLAKARGWWLWSDPADPKKVLPFGWLPMCLWGVASGFFVAVVRRNFASRDTLGGFIILGAILAVPLLLTILRLTLTK